MPTLADAPFRKVTLNLYEADVQAMEQYYGHGWSSYVRDDVAKHANLVRRAVNSASRKRRLGDIDE